MAATRTGLTTTDRKPDGRPDELITRPDTESLPTLFSRLGEDVMDLFNSQLALFKVEIKEEASAYARGITMIGLGAVIATIGFALLNVAIAFAVSTLFAGANFSQPASYALGFVVTGAFYILVGAIVVMVMKGRLAKQELVPRRTVAELRKDKQWLKNEL
jgi:uncharacterized membrane protein YqjE